MAIIATRVTKGNANLRNGFIKRVQSIEYWVNDNSVMINVANDRTGLLNGHITIDKDAMLAISREFIEKFGEEK